MREKPPAVIAARQTPGLQATLDELDKCPAVGGSLRDPNDNSDSLLYVFAFLQIFTIGFDVGGVAFAAVVFGAVLLGLANQNLLVMDAAARWPVRLILASLWLGAVTLVYIGLRVGLGLAALDGGMWRTATGLVAMALAYGVYRIGHARVLARFAPVA